MKAMNPRKEMRACRGAAENENCRVCSEKAHGFHFGVLVCRACAAFFRRTIALNMHYHCRFERECQIDKSVRAMCRSCRHSKCLRVGMKTDAVQLTKEREAPRSVGEYEEDANSSSQKQTSEAPSCSTLPSLSPPDNTHLSKFEEDELQMYLRINPIFEEAARNPKTSSDLPSIEMFRLGMNHLRMRRLEVQTERLIDPEPFKGTDEFVNILEDNVDKFLKMRAREIDLSAELVTFIQPFINLPAEQRWCHFKQFSTSFDFFERAFENYRVLGNDYSVQRNVLFNGQNFEFMRLLREDAALTKEPKYRALNRLVLNSVYKPEYRSLRDEFFHTVAELKLSEIEFAALCLHLLWLYAYSDADHDSCRKVPKIYRRQAFVELHDYYVNSMGMKNYASRLGDFMSLMASLEKCVFEMKQVIAIGSVFCPNYCSSLVTITK